MTIRHFAEATFFFLLTAFFVLSSASFSHAQELGLIKITKFEGETAISPSWSPQRNAISFITNRGSKNGRIFVLQSSKLFAGCDEFFHAALPRRMNWKTRLRLCRAGIFAVK